MKIINKRGQMTIWIIVALVIIAIIFILYFLRPKITSITQSELNPNPIIDSCVQDSVNEALKIMLPRGGFIHPNNTKMYNNINVSYLCENIGYFSPCINQHPLLIREMEGQISEYIEPKLENCFDSLKQELEQKQNAVEMGTMSYSVELREGYVQVYLNRNVTLTKNQQTQSYYNFDSKVISPAYNLASLAGEIVNQEATNCYFEYVGYMILYPRYSIKLDKQSDDTKIYSIKDDYTNAVMNLAIRGCSIPAGI